MDSNYIMIDARYIAVLIQMIVNIFLVWSNHYFRKHEEMGWVFYIYGAIVVCNLIFSIAFIN